MLAKLVLKLCFKACVPLVLVAGIATYGVYLNGGDPGAIWKAVASGASSELGTMLGNARSTVSNSVANVKDGAIASADNPTTEVYMWKDASGVAHFSNSKPSDVQSQTLQIDPDVNVIAPFQSVSADAKTVDKAPRSAKPNRQKNESELTKTTNFGSDSQFKRNTDEAVSNLESDLGETLPGIAGHVLSGENGASGMNPEQLIKLLQGMQ